MTRRLALAALVALATLCGVTESAQASTTYVYRTAYDYYHYVSGVFSEQFPRSTAPHARYSFHCASGHGPAVLRFNVYVYYPQDGSDILSYSGYAKGYDVYGDVETSGPYGEYDFIGVSLTDADGTTGHCYLSFSYSSQ